MSEKKKFLIIDSYALIYRAYYAFPPTLQTKDGTLTNAAYGFTSLLLDVIDKFEPDYLVAVYESETPLIRSSEYLLYKANRKETDNELKNQIPIVKRILETMDVPVLHVNGYEADDVIGTLNKQIKNKNIQKIIVTGDQDLFQLIENESTSIYLAGSRFSQSKLFDAEKVEEKLGIKTSQVVDYKALCGDPSDNIPGVKGVGKKTAQKLLEEFGSLDQIYKNIDKIKGAVQTKLQNDYEMAIKSQKLAKIETDVPLSFDINTAKFKDLNGSKLAKLMEELEFKSLVKKLDKIVKDYVGEENIGLFAEEDKSSIPVNVWESKSINSEKVFLLADIEGLDKSPINYKLKNIFFTTDSKDVFLVKESNFNKFAKEIAKKKIITTDFKELAHSFLNSDLSINLENFEDLGFATMVISSGLFGHGISDVFEYLGLNQSTEIENNLQSFKKAYEEISKKLKENDEAKEVYKLEKSIIDSVVQMERTGLDLDLDRLKTFEEDLEKKKSKLISDIFENVGHEFNINSPKQVGEVLFDEKSLTGARKTKSGQYSTNEKVLKNLKDQDPLVGMILDYREIDKLLSTYIKTLANYLDDDGKVHAKFDQLGAVSGRFSSKDPNMQNIPINESLNINVRSAFKVSKGKTFVAFDYSQQELRILASLAGEQKMIDSFNDDEDIHKITGAQIFNKSVKDVDDYERSVGKTINFSVVYGISSYGLSERMQIGRSDAEHFINQFYKTYPNIKAFFDDNTKKIESKKYSETILGRKRINNQIKSRQFYVRSAAQRELLNFMIQGSAADIMKLAMKKFDDVQDEINADLLLQIHDEFVFEIDDDEKKIKDFASKIKKIMETVYKMDVKFKVDCKVGKRWGEFVKLKIKD